MTRDEITRYQVESVKRASLPPVAKHSQKKRNQSNKFERIYQTLGEPA
ncbi:MULTISPECIES: hypothetical protein [Klebsiella pneumoniae complex]|nr:MULTISPECIES: hypothetical protein [Klebsiella]MCR8654063.1 hypothetical protein [Klebsiella variicola]